MEKEKEKIACCGNETPGLYLGLFFHTHLSSHKWGLWEAEA